jgi:hypothetical protein
MITFVSVVIATSSRIRWVTVHVLYNWFCSSAVKK